MTLTRRHLELKIVINNSVSVTYHLRKSANPHVYQQTPHVQAGVALS